MAVTAVGTGLLAHFSALEDPRQSGKVLYPLPEILLVVLCGTLSGCDDFVEMALWGREHLSFNVIKLEDAKVFIEQHGD